MGKTYMSATDRAMAKLKKENPDAFKSVKKRASKKTAVKKKRGK